MHNAIKDRGARQEPRVAIIGAGMSGIGMAATLRRAGVESFRLYEMADDFGGTWRANTYPGLACDVASRYYCYTWAPNPDWSYVYSPGPEIHAYLKRVAEDLGLASRTSFNSEVAEAEWVGDAWRLRTKDGQEADYDFIVTACGGLVRAAKPHITGLDTFAGASFHSAEWDHSVPLDGQRIAVIGTGSTGVQITRALAPRAGKFELFQRTPQWIFPLPNRSYSRATRWLYRRFPTLNRIAYNGWQRTFERTFGRAVIEPGFWRRVISAACKLHLRVRVRDPDLRRRFTPDSEPMCKRMVMAVNFYPLFERPNVELVDTAIDHVEPRGIVTKDGVLHELDVIVLATGFYAHNFVRPMELIGPGGTRLSDAWRDEPWAYKTVALPGFPNFLMLIGPHSPFGNQSLFAISQTQQDYAMKCIELWRDGHASAMAPKQDAADRFNEEMRAAVGTTIWATGGCNSWYIGKDGLPAVWPYPAAKHASILSEPQLDEWELDLGAQARQ